MMNEKFPLQFNERGEKIMDLEQNSGKMQNYCNNTQLGVY
jgi:hypothetical protein